MPPLPPPRSPGCTLLVLAGLALGPFSCATTAPVAAAPPPAPASPDAGPAPCDDFDAHANAAWRAANPRPPGAARWSRRSVARELNRRQLEALLTEVSAKADWPRGSAEQVAGDFVASCLDEAAIEAAGRTPVDPWLADIDKARTPADVQRQLRHLHEHGIPALFGTSAAFDPREPARTVATFGAGELGLGGRAPYLGAEPRHDERRAQYAARVAAVLASAGRPEAEARAGALAILGLERRLAEATLSAAEAAAPAGAPQRTGFAALQRLAPHLDWAAYFGQAGWGRVEVDVAEPRLLRQVDLELTRTPVAVWKDYLRWRVLDTAAPFLSSSFGRPAAEFKALLGGGPAAAPPRARQCAESAEQLLGEAVGRLYADRHFPPAARARARAMAAGLLAALRGQVGSFGWMTPATQARALAKLETVNFQLGAPEHWAGLSDLSIGRGTYWANVAAGRRHRAAEERRLVTRPTDFGNWVLPASSPDAYIEPQLNELVLPAGFLQPMGFEAGAGDAVLYGGFGAALAHDLFHSLDPLGADFDPQGRPGGWWTEADRKGFQARTRCVLEQYEAYEVAPGLRHKGPLVLGEAVADLVGTRTAWLAFKAAAAPTPAAERQFFEALAHFRGDEQSPEAQAAHLKSDIHALARYRILGTLSNLPEFQQAFDCRPGAPMVREQRCTLW